MHFRCRYHNVFIKAIYIDKHIDIHFIMTIYIDKISKIMIMWYEFMII